MHQVVRHVKQERLFLAAVPLFPLFSDEFSSLLCEHIGDGIALFTTEVLLLLLEGIEAVRLALLRSVFLLKAKVGRSPFAQMPLPEEPCGIAAIFQGLSHRDLSRRQELLLRL